MPYDPEGPAFESPSTPLSLSEPVVAREGSSEEGNEFSKHEAVDEHRTGAPSQPPQAFNNIEITMIDDNIYVGDESTLWRPMDARGVYGGQIVGQALAAAFKTIPKDSGKHVHSLHCYFLMKGDANHRIVYCVTNLRDGASFSSRLVQAQQYGKAIFILMASFQVPHVGRVIEHAFTMPLVPRPEELPTMEQYYASLLQDPRCPSKWRPFLEKRTKGNGPIDMRPCIVSDFFHFQGPPPADRPRFPELSLAKPRQAFWMKTVKPLPNDPATHAAVLAYASDMGLLATSKHYVPTVAISVIASLDHAVWFHSPFRVDEWLLYYLESHRATEGRGIAIGLVFTEAGVLAASVVKEGVIRLKRPSGDDNKSKL